MKITLNKFALSALCALSITAYAGAQELAVTTDNPLLTSSAHLASPAEAQDLFFATELISFFNNNASSCTTGQTVQAQSDQNNDSNALENAADSATESVGNAAQSAQEYVPGANHDYLSNILGEDPCYHMPADQAEKLRTLHVNYIPVTVSIVNTSDKALVISKDAYVGGLEKYIVSKKDVLSAYPLLQPLNKTQKLRTQLYCGGGLILTGAGGWQAYKAHKAESAGKLRYVYAGLLGIPGLALLYASYRRYTNTEMPLEQLLAKYAHLSRQTQGATLTTLTANTSEMLACADTYTIPAQSVFCEMLFIDRKAYEAAGGGPLNLVYTVKQ